MKPVNQVKDYSGFVYVLKNESENRYKVGMTKRNPLIRAKELSTSYPEDFFVIYSRRFKNAYKAERKVFDLLKDFMPSDKKEVVDVYDVDMIISVIDYVGETEDLLW